MDWNKYEEWLQICEVDQNQIYLVTEFLCDIGTLIHFNESKGDLKNLVILNPQWLANIMSCLITTKHNFAKDGILPQAAITQIFNHYPKKQHEQFLVLLENFSILYPLKRKFKNENCYLVPSLLPEEFPGSEVTQYWPFILPKGFIEYGRVREFSFLPMGLFARMIVYVLHIENVEALVFWRTGLLVRSGNQIAIITYQSKIFTLKFNVRVPLNFRSSRENISLLRELVEITETLISCYYPRLSRSTHRFISCIHCKEMRETNSIENPFLFTEDKVIQCINQNILSLYCHHIQSPSRCVSIVDLAPDLAFEDLPSIQSSDLIIEKMLGQGGFGTVYKGKWNNKVVAIKELTTDSSHDSSEIDSETNCLVSSGNTQISKFQEFQRECWIMSTLSHPNITQLYGVSVTPILRMIMEFCPCGDLFNLLHPKDSNGVITNIKYSDLSDSFRFKISLDIAKGMRYLQTIKPPIIHRDLRSLNIFLVSLNEKAKVRAQVADFGLSCRVAPKIKGFLSTWQWLAPEVIDSDNDQYDQSADTYSFGIVLWEIFTAQIPFGEYYMDSRFGKKVGPGNSIFDYEINIIQIKKAIIEHKLRPSIPDNIPPTIQKIIASCWQNDPNLRPSFEDIVLKISKLANEKFVSVDDEVNIFLNQNNQKNLIKYKSKAKSKSTVDKNSEILSSCNIKYELCDVFNFIEEFEDDSTIMDACIDFITNFIWIAYASGNIGIFNSNGKLELYFRVHLDRISSLIRINNFIWSSGEDGMIYVWDIKKNDVVSFWKASQLEGDVVSGLLPIKVRESNVKKRRRSSSSSSSSRIKRKSKKNLQNIETDENIYYIWSWLPVSRSIRIWDSKVCFLFIFVLTK